MGRARAGTAGIRRAARACLIACALSLAGSAPALAQQPGRPPERVASGRPLLGVVPTRDQLHQSSTPGPSGRAVSRDPACSNCRPPLLYQPGPAAVVMGGDGPDPSPGRVTVTPVFWAPPGYQFAAGYQGLVLRYLHDVATGVGLGTDVYSVLGEYYQQLSATAARQPIRADISAGAPVYLSAAFPASCSAPYAATTCVSDAAVRDEMAAALDARDLPVGLGYLYLVFLPPEVGECASFNAGAPPFCAGQQYCAYHRVGADSRGSYYYGVFAYPQLDSCGTPNSPNGDPHADATINLVTHEILDSITDPTGSAWMDTGGGEISDECAWVFGPVLGTADPPSSPPGWSSGYDQVINGDRYDVQEAFSNVAFSGGLSEPGGSPSVAGCLSYEAPAALTGSEPPAVRVGARVYEPVQVSGMPAPTVQLAAGSLPAGITLNGSGDLVGVARQAGSFSFTLSASNGLGPAARLRMTLLVRGSSAGRGGYRLFGADGGVFAFGDAGFFGSVGGERLAAPVVGVGAG